MMALPFLNPAFITPELDQAVRGGMVNTKFRYELLDNTKASKGFLDCVQVGGSVRSSYLSEIKTTCSFSIAEVGNFSQINFLTDRVKIYCDILNYTTNEYMSYPLGVYLMSAGTRTASEGVISREVFGYDQTQILKDAKHLERFTVAVGTNIIDTVRTLLNTYGITHNIADSTEVMVAERSYDPGTEIIATINDLFSMITYRSLYFDFNGTAVSSNYIASVNRSIETEYITDDTSLIAPGTELNQDLFNVPNQVLVVVSQPDRPVITATATNDNPESPTSTVSRGSTIVQVYSENEDVTTQDQAQAKADRYLTEISQIFETIQFSTPIIPVHGENTIVSIKHTDLDISAVYSEIEWSITLQAGTYMTHTARRTVNV